MGFSKATTSGFSHMSCIRCRASNRSVFAKDNSGGCWFYLTIADTYRVSIDGSSLVRMGAYSEDGGYLGSAADNFSDQFTMTPMLAALIAQYILTNGSYCKAFLDFSKAPNA